MVGMRAEMWVSAKVAELADLTVDLKDGEWVEDLAG